MHIFSLIMIVIYCPLLLLLPFFLLFLKFLPFKFFLFFSVLLNHPVPPDSFSAQYSVLSVTSDNLSGNLFLPCLCIPRGVGWTSIPRVPSFTSPKKTVSGLPVCCWIRWGVTCTGLRKGIQLSNCISSSVHPGPPPPVSKGPQYPSSWASGGFCVSTRPIISAFPTSGLGFSSRVSLVSYDSSLFCFQNCVLFFLLFSLSLWVYV